MNPPRHDTRWLLICLFAAAILLCAVLKRGTLDDLYITFTYARNLAEGHGFSVWNIGERPVEGSTSTTWMVILATGMLAGVPPFWSSFVLASVSFGVLVLLFFMAAQRQVTHPESRYRGLPVGVWRTAGWLILTYLPVAWYAASGMESTFFALQLGALLISPALMQPGPGQVRLQCALASLMVLTRPEGLLLAPLVSAYLFWITPGRAWQHLSPLAVSVATAALLTVFRVQYFGDPFPNTYYAKAAGDLPHHLYWGLRNVSRFLTYTAPAWALLLWGLFTAWRRRWLTQHELFLALVVLIYFAYMMKSGGDPESAFPLWRHFVHIAPVWLLLAACALERLGQARGGRVAWVMAFIVLTQATLSAKYVRNDLIGWPNYAQSDSDSEFFAFMRQVADANSVAASGYAGHWGWLFPGKMIDMWGLNNRHIAHHGQYQRFGALDSKSDMRWVVEQQPDIINLDISPDQLNSGLCPTETLTGERSESMMATLQHPLFQRDYLFLANAPYATFKRAVFVHRRFVPQLAARWDTPAKLVPFADTPLPRACKVGAQGR
jgi:arabinofuranosyltransferase